MLYPLFFQPLFQERVWGGRSLARLYGKSLPGTGPIGESWEISDRPGNLSLITNGSFAGRDLRWLMEQHRSGILGNARPLNGRFPLLIKLLDAQDKLSLQVHPPAHLAAGLGGEPKTEMWYVAEAAPGAELFVGLKRGVTRVEFERRIQDGSVADCFHRIAVRTGDVMFLPSGRVHAIGAGLVLFEIQQNSDTTYRVFDWNRVGLDGKPRELHITASLASIDFTDFEPGLVASRFEDDAGLRTRMLVRDPLFSVQETQAVAGASIPLAPGRMQILGCLWGRLNVAWGSARYPFGPGQFCLIPAALEGVVLRAETDSAFLRTTAG